MSEWQPIETAPAGDEVLVYQKGNQSIAQFDGYTWFGRANGNYVLTSYQEEVLLTPTHWMPLPEPPKQR